MKPYFEELSQSHTKIKTRLVAWEFLPHEFGIFGQNENKLVMLHNLMAKTKYIFDTKPLPFNFTKRNKLCHLS